MDTAPPEAEEILTVWLGPLDEHGLSDDTHRQRWFAKDPAFDAELRERFGALHAAAARGDLAHWGATPRGRLALILLLDQLSRNLFRDTPDMYAHDARALEVAEQALAAGDEATLPAQARYFLYMPFMHAESLEAQDRCVALFEKAQVTLPAAVAHRFDSKWAVMHRDIVARFGRFPHRNAILGRESTEEERVFLDEPGSSF